MISAGVVLWGAFPAVYSTLISAFYVPTLLMLTGLTLRGPALKLRYKTERTPWILDLAFCGGSVLAAFMQGMMIGALVEGLPMSGGRYIGGEFGWLSLFAVLCGLGLCFGYALLGACWLLKTCGNTFRERAYRTIRHIAGGLLGFFVVLFFYVLVDMHVLLRCLERPYLLVCLAVGILNVFLLGVTVRHVRHHLPFYTAAAILAAAFGTLAISFWPYMIPFAVTIDAAAAPLSDLASKVWTGALVFALIVAYVQRNYAVFGADVCQILAKNRSAAVPPDRGQGE